MLVAGRAIGAFCDVNRALSDVIHGFCGVNHAPRDVIHGFCGVNHALSDVIHGFCGVNHALSDVNRASCDVAAGRRRFVRPNRARPAIESWPFGCRRDRPGVNAAATGQDAPDGARAGKTATA